MRNPEVSLFIPCLVDQVYPEMGLAMAGVLEHLGYSLSYNPQQTCCGQPAFNAGHRHEALTVARHFLDVFEGADAIVCPSGSCTAMVRNYFPFLFHGDQRLQEATSISSKVFEFSQFLQMEGKAESIDGRMSGRIGFHNSCHSFRELRLVDAPMALLRRISGYELVEVESDPVCCGFGGLFSVKFENIASAMAKSRLREFVDGGVETLVSNDPGCIMHMRQEAETKGYEITICHLVEFLAQAMGLSAVDQISEN